MYKCFADAEGDHDIYVSPAPSMLTHESEDGVPGWWVHAKIKITNDNINNKKHDGQGRVCVLIRFNV